MIAILVVNLLLVGAAILVPNDWLKHDAYWLFLGQALTLVPYLVRRANAARHLFLPSLFSLAYFLVNQVLGSYLVPRYYGWNKEYGAVALGIDHYNAIIPYLLMANVGLFMLGTATLRALARVRSGPGRELPREPQRRFLRAAAEATCIVVFAAVSGANLLGGFSLQLALMITHLLLVVRRPLVHRGVVYTLYLAAMLALSYQSKRQIVIVLFLILFLEARRSGALLRLRPRLILQGGAAVLLFAGLVLTASVLRGYGGFEITSPLQALRAVPQYVGSEIFVDGVVDNLELNYGYGSAITPIDLTLRGVLPYQYGTSLWKLVFLPIPRSLFPDKPESALQIYTREFDPGMWAEGGSLPVAFQSDMFMNLGFVGLLPFVFVLALIDRCYVGFQRAAPDTFEQRATLFLSITTLILVRGSGLELYVLTFLLGTPVLIVASGVAQIPSVLKAVRRGRVPSGSGAAAIV